MLEARQLGRADVEKESVALPRLPALGNPGGRPHFTYRAEDALSWYGAHGTVRRAPGPR
jgi:hypothetical protein